MNISTRFDVDQVVKIIALDLPGRILYIRLDGRVTDYFVAWWSDGQRRSEWLHESELE